MKTLYHNAVVVSPTSPATCLVVEGDTIIFVGTENDAPPSDKQVDLGGRRVLPGFIDGHMHLLLFGAGLSKIDLTPCKNLADIRSTIVKAAREQPSAARLFCRGWMHSMTDGRALSSMLDDLDPRPIFIDAKDLHSAWCSSAALRDLGVDRTTPDPAGGQIARDPVTGQPTGLLSEAAAVNIVWPHVARVASTDEKLGYIRAAIRAYNAAGYTGMIEMATDENLWGMMALLRERERESGDDNSFGTATGSGEEEEQEQRVVPIRLAAHWIITPADTEAAVFAQVDRAIALHAQYNLATSPDFRIAGIKVICDGVVDACTAALTEPYSTTGVTPDPLWPAELLRKVVQRADRAGLQCALHAIGDWAVRLAIETLEAVATPGRRHRIEHLELTAPGDAARLAALGITASVQPVHADPAILRAWPRLLGAERCRRAFAYREFHDAGAVLAIGTDSPTAPHLPLPNLYTATTRRSAREPQSEERWNPEYALTMAQAVSAATKGSAYSCFADQRTGELREGLKADFVVMDMAWEGERLLEGRVWGTFFGGRQVYSSQE